MSGGSLLRPDLDEPQAPVKVGGHEFNLTRARLGGFLRLQAELEAYDKAAKSWDLHDMAEGLWRVLNTGLGLDRATFETAPWFEVVEAFVRVQTVNALPETEKLAMLRMAEKSRPVPWDYEGRTAIAFVHILAESYGWSKQEVLDLWPEEALALMQEIEASDFVRREFEHMHSQLAYKYDKRGKGTYQPLKKPAWMVFRPKRLVTQLLRKALPLGNVVFHDGMGPEVKEQQP